MVLQEHVCVEPEGPACRWRRIHDTRAAALALDSSRARFASCVCGTCRSASSVSSGRPSDNGLKVCEPPAAQCIQLDKEKRAL